MKIDFPKPDKKELLTLLVIVLIGAALRLYGISEVTVEHFDEGVYASNLWFGPENNFEYPQRPFYAPPMLPALIEITMTIFGPGTIGVLGINLLAGILTIPVIWLLGRSWFGPHAGLISAALCSFSEFHIAYSRTALTDPLLLFWFLLALYFGSQALQYSTPDSQKKNFYEQLGGRNGVLLCLAAGVMTALAWWTKYNGWLPLAVLISGYAGWRIINFKNGESFLGPIVKLIIIAGVAFLLWAPYLNSLQEIGGYSAVAENHKKYVVGLAGWKDSFFRQAGNLYYFDGLIGYLGVIVALLILTQLDVVKHKLAVFAACLFLFLLSLPPENFGKVFFILGITFLMIAFVLIQSANGRAQSTAKTLPFWLMSAWLTGMFLATPMYTPYPRLLLPLLSATWIAGGFALVHFVNVVYQYNSNGPNIMVGDSPISPEKALYFYRISIPVILIGIVYFGINRPTKFTAWESRDSFWEVAQQVVEETDEIAVDEKLEPEKNAFYVYAEPGLFFQLAAEDKLVGPTGNLKFADPERDRLPVPTFLLTGPHAKRSVEFEEQWALFGDQFEKVAEYPYQPSAIVLLNNMSASELRKTKRKDLVETITLYRLKE